MDGGREEVEGVVLTSAHVHPRSVNKEGNLHTQTPRKVERGLLGKMYEAKGPGFFQ